MKYFLFVILLFSAFCSLGQDKQDYIHGWVSGSTLWGQGNAGLKLKVFKKDFIVSDNFVFNWDKAKIDYNETEVGLSSKNSIYGLRGRWDTEYLELSPFVGHRERIKAYLPTSLYNEVEYRDRKEDDYFRSSHTLTIVYPHGFFGEKEIKPFAANSVFFDVNDVSFEKNRLYLGYFLDIGRYHCMVYYIPRVWGDIDQSWDDSHKFGAAATLKF